MEAVAKRELAFVPARRVNQSLSAVAEKRALVWLAGRMPGWVSSDHLTALGLVAQVGAGVGYWLAGSHRVALLGVIGCIALNWLGDSLDGTVARVRGQQRPRYGFYVDHMVDLFGSLALMVGLGMSGLVHWPVAAAMLVGFQLLAAESYLATYTLGRFELSQGMFGPTEIRLLLIVGNLALLHSVTCTMFGHRWLLFDVGGVIASVGMAAMLVMVAARHGVQLYREEPVGASTMGGRS